MAIYYNGHQHATKGGGSSGGGGISYSTTEQDTGLKWIDGKPIYQKTYHITESAETEEKEYDISNDNVDTMIECNALVRAGTGGGNNVYTAPRIINGTYFISVSASDTSIVITAISYKFTEAYVTLRYTKTTDTV